MSTLLTIVLLAAAQLVAPAIGQSAEQQPDDAWLVGRLPAIRGGTAIAHEVTVGPRGFVAVGESCRKRAFCTAAAWHSSDGIDWTVSDVDRRERRAGRAKGASLDHVAWGPGGYVAVGSFVPPIPEGAFDVAPGAAVWRSKDGRRWRRVVTGRPFTSNPTPVGIAGSEAGYLALRGPRGVLASQDGVDWTWRQDGDVFKNASLSEATPLTDGYATIGSRFKKSAVWRTTGDDGWESTIVAGKRDLRRLAAVDDRVVVVQGRPTEWMDDTIPRGGLTWTVEGDGPAVMSSVPGATGLYAVGRVGDRFLVAGQACGPSLWVSSDGTRWAPLAWSGDLPRGADRWHDVDIAASEDRVVIAGSAEVPRPGKRATGAKLVGFTLSAPLAALDDVVDEALEADPAKGIAESMPIAQLTSPDGTTVEGQPASGCWMSRDAVDESVAECRNVGLGDSPRGDLPLIGVAGEGVPLRLTLSDGSAFSAASIYEYPDSAGSTVSSTDPCEPRKEATFTVNEGDRVLVVWVTFECGQGNSAFLFHFRSPSES